MEKKEAMEILKDFHDKSALFSVRTALETLIPELKESEDERIRKELLESFKYQQRESHIDKEWLNGIKLSEVVAWLEKQGKYANFRNKIQVGDKVTRNEDGVFVNLSQFKRLAKPADMVEPKFKVGDWVVYYRNDSSREVLQIYDIRDGRYYFNDNIHFSWSVKECDEKCHLWTIVDAKDGDVVAFSDDTIVMFKDLYNYTTFHSYCHIEDGVFNISKDDMPDWWEGKGFYPATKEQCDTLFAKMKEAGYEWDADKKELNEIEQ